MTRTAFRESINVEVKDLVKKRQIYESQTLLTVLINTNLILSDYECLLPVCSKYATNNPAQNKTRVKIDLYSTRSRKHCVMISAA